MLSRGLSRGYDASAAKMSFDWDPKKNEENIRKHGLDFEDARVIFEGPMLVRIDDRFDYDEVRMFGLGLLINKIVVVVFLEVDDDIIRVISMRRALKHEREEYYEYVKNRLGTAE